MSGDAPSPSVGDAAPELSLRTIDGAAFHLSEQRGRPVLVSFLRHAG